MEDEATRAGADHPRSDSEQARGQTPVRDPSSAAASGMGRRRRGDRARHQARGLGDGLGRDVHPAPGAPRLRAPRAPGDSGLYRLIELHAFNAAGDAAVAISLAGTLFFAQPGRGARAGGVVPRD